MAEASHRFGAQCVVASIDAAMIDGTYRVFVKGGTVPTDREAVSWARECARMGAGEILLTSIDRDGVRSGYDLALTRAISEAVSVPVIASGGAGSAAHVCDALTAGGADAALVAGILHDGVTTVAALKGAMTASGIPTRHAGAGINGDAGERAGGHVA